jgi:hypothetical protein
VLIIVTQGGCISELAVEVRTAVPHRIVTGKYVVETGQLANMLAAQAWEPVKPRASIVPPVGDAAWSAVAAAEILAHISEPDCTEASIVL